MGVIQDLLVSPSEAGQKDIVDRQIRESFPDSPSLSTAEKIGLGFLLGGRGVSLENPLGEASLISGSGQVSRSGNRRFRRQIAALGVPESSRCGAEGDRQGSSWIRPVGKLGRSAAWMEALEVLSCALFVVDSAAELRFYRN